MSDQPSARPAPGPKIVLRRLIARQALPLGLFALCLWLLQGRAADLDFGVILRDTRAIPPGAWAAAVVATLISFWAVGRYDAIIHRILATGVPDATAGRAGIVAIATAQTAGFGLLTGTLARWRMLPDLSLWQSARLTTAVTISFMAGLAVVAAAAALWVGSDGPVPVWIATFVLIAAILLAGVSLWRPRRLLQLRFPPLKAQITILALVALDTGAAAAAIHVLLPTSDMPPAGLFYAVFLLALGAGLIGATPGGVGPFEFVCLACLPSVPDATLLAAITGYRVVYFGLPGIAAVALLLIGARPAPSRNSNQADLMPSEGALAIGSSLDRVLFRARRAEAQLLRQGEFDLLCENHVPVALAAATGQSLIVLGDPLSPADDGTRLVSLASRLAAHRLLEPCLYKCSARTAVAARRAGWRVAPVSHEAWVAPQNHNPDLPQCRQLRRQLRKAETAELHIAEAGAHAPLDDMARIAEAWSRSRGGSRGFSLGRFNAALIDRQRVFLCYDNQRQLVAFLTLHVAQSEWALDLMCQSRHAPPGAMHLLVSAAIESARRHACPRVSLAAVPRPMPHWLPGRIAAWCDAKSGTQGLSRFKSAFNPSWEPLYIAAPSRFGLALSAIDLVDRITRPGRRGRATLKAES